MPKLTTPKRHAGRLFPSRPKSPGRTPTANGRAGQTGTALLLYGIELAAQLFCLKAVSNGDERSSVASLSVIPRPDGGRSRYRLGGPRAISAAGQARGPVQINAPYLHRCVCHAPIGSGTWPGRLTSPSACRSSVHPTATAASCVSGVGSTLVLASGKRAVVRLGAMAYGTVTKLVALVAVQNPCSALCLGTASGLLRRRCGLRRFCFADAPFRFWLPRSGPPRKASPCLGSRAHSLSGARDRRAEQENLHAPQQSDSHWIHRQ